MEAAELLQILLNTLYVSALPALLASIIGIPLAAYLVIGRPRGAELLEGLFNGLVGVPTVLLGLLLYLLLSRSGPLGALNQLFTLEAVVVGHTLLVTPLTTAFAISALSAVDRRLIDLARTLGLGSGRTTLVIIRQSLPGLLAASIAGFSRAAGELGVAIMVGGDIRFRTRVLTTAVAHETLLGNWSEAITLGGLLLLVTLTVSVSLHLLRWRFRG